MRLGIGEKLVDDLEQVPASRQVGTGGPPDDELLALQIVALDFHANLVARIEHRDLRG